jgi:hypothetical protein
MGDKVVVRYNRSRYPYRSFQLPQAEEQSHKSLTKQNGI